jgi:hypothetical protein
VLKIERGGKGCSPGEQLIFADLPSFRQTAENPLVNELYILFNFLNEDEKDIQFLFDVE